MDIKNSDKKATCPDCSGACGSATWKKDKWFLEARYTSTIGQIQTETYGKRSEGVDGNKYMIEATGIGSGTAWKETDLFFTKEAARAECDKRNELLNVKN